MRGKRLLGLIILAVVALAAGGYNLVRTGSLDPASGGVRYTPVTLKGYVGGEKVGFLQDAQVIKILRDRYKITLDVTKAGSIEMVRGNVDQVDFLWPSSPVAPELYKAVHGAPAQEQVIFNSPIVLYSWDIVADALEQQGVVKRVDNTYYIVDFPKLVDLVVKETTWKEIGVPQLYGKMTIFSTDPVKSNSGNQFAALLASTLNNGEVVDENTVEAQLPRVKGIFARLGFLQSSSGDLFSQYLKQGVGAYPLVVGYENQIVEFSIDNKDSLPLIKQKVRILYPQPTVWSSHILLVRSDKAKRLVLALQDPELQRIAWSKHGFRTGMAGAKDDPSVLQLAGIPATIEMVMPMPNAATMDKIINSLQ
jgi:hypothetical protein